MRLIGRQLSRLFDLGGGANSGDTGNAFGAGTQAAFLAAAEDHREQLDAGVDIKRTSRWPGPVR